MRIHAIRNVVLLANVVVWGFVIPSLALPDHAAARQVAGAAATHPGQPSR